MSGILNGIDTEEWNPATDPLLEKHDDANNLKGKQALQAVLGLPQKPGTPLIGLVSRLVTQKKVSTLLSTPFPVW